HLAAEVASRIDLRDRRPAGRAQTCQDPRIASRAPRHARRAAADAGRDPREVGAHENLNDRKPNRGLIMPKSVSGFIFELTKMTACGPTRTSWEIVLTSAFRG